MLGWSRCLWLLVMDMMSSLYVWCWFISLINVNIFIVLVSYQFKLTWIRAETLTQYFLFINHIDWNLWTKSRLVFSICVSGKSGNVTLKLPLTDVVLLTSKRTWKLRVLLLFTWFLCFNWWLNSDYGYKHIYFWNKPTFSFSRKSELRLQLNVPSWSWRTRTRTDPQGEQTPCRRSWSGSKPSQKTEAEIKCPWFSGLWNLVQHNSLHLVSLCFLPNSLDPWTFSCWSSFQQEEETLANGQDAQTNFLFGVTYQLFYSPNAVRSYSCWSSN